jgi:hypothetical protein
MTTTRKPEPSTGNDEAPTALPAAPPEAVGPAPAVVDADSDLGPLAATAPSDAAVDDVDWALFDEMERAWEIERETPYWMRPGYDEPSWEEECAPDEAEPPPLLPPVKPRS